MTTFFLRICPIDFNGYPSYEGEEYIQLGLSAIFQNSPFSVSRGIFTSVMYNVRGHFLGSASSNPGDSGGGCFSEASNILYGINVGCENIPITEDTTTPQELTLFPVIFFTANEDSKDGPIVFGQLKSGLLSSFIICGVNLCSQDNLAESLAPSLA
jgi:hypothetical protein